MEWIILCNPDDYDIDGAFDNLPIINYRQSTNIRPGDIVYVYCSRSMQYIKYKCQVLESDIYSETMPIEPYDDTPYHKGLGPNKTKRWMRLKPIYKYDDNVLSLKLLKKYGVNSVQGPSMVKRETLEFINKVEKQTYLL